MAKLVYGKRMFGFQQDDFYLKLKNFNYFVILLE